MGANEEGRSETSARARPSIGMLWKCCNVYSRVYLNHAQTHFAGNCPRCGARMRIAAVPADHTDTGFWTAG